MENKKYKIYKGTDGKYVFSFSLGNFWGFYNTGWTGSTQPRIEDPNHRMVIKFDSESDARKKAEELTIENNTTWEEIKDD